MKTEGAARRFAESCGDLLTALARALGPGGEGLRLVDAAGATVWGDGAGTAPAPQSVVDIPLGPYGALRLPAGRNCAWEAALGALLASTLETDDEFNQLTDEHIAVTNQLLAMYKIINNTRETWELPARMEAILVEAARHTAAGQTVLHLSDPRWPLALTRGPAGPGRDRAARLVEELTPEPRTRVDAEGRHVAAPIVIRGETAGWLAVSEPPAGGYKAKDVKLLEALSRLAAGFLSTARLQEEVIASLRLQQEIEIASRIQDLLLSGDLPDQPGISLTASCRPASQVGGDFYAAHRGPGGDLVFAIGDVAGKGVPAALLMAMARTAVLSLSHLYAEPMRILRALSDSLFADLERVGKFVTLVVGRYRVGDGRIELANAGHSPVIFLPRPGVEPVMIPPQLPPIGVVPEVDGDPAVLPLEAGGLLAIMSDGLTEARSRRGEFFGAERLCRALGAGAGQEGRALQDDIFRAVDAFTVGAPRSDDQTLLLLQRRGS